MLVTHQSGPTARPEWPAVVWLIVLLALALVNSQPVQASDPPGQPRVVATGDIHGNLLRLQALLRHTGLTDDKDHWTGGNAIFVQTGDFLDRGPQVRETMDLLMRLQKEAERAGGRVIVLLGNHEVMNLVGDLRYVHPDAFSSFADHRSEDRRAKAFERYLKLRQRQAREQGQPPPDAAALRPAWMESRPPGYLEYVEAMGSGGRYGKWIRQLPAVFRTADMLFVHGGIHPGLVNISLDDINQRISQELRLFDWVRRHLISRGLADPGFALHELLESGRLHFQSTRTSNPVGTTTLEWADPQEEEFGRRLGQFLDLAQWYGMHPHGPLWYRGLAVDPEELLAEHLDRLLEHHQVHGLVVGHTIVSKEQILTRFDGRVHLVDTVVPAALVIEAGEVRNVYPKDGAELEVSEDLPKPD